MVMKSSDHRSFKQHTNAFTLIELIFVMILLGLLAGFAIPKMANIAGLTQKTQVTKMAGFLTRAYQMALLRGKNFRLVIDLGEKKFWIEEEIPPQTKPLLPDEFNVDDVLMEFRKEAETYMDEEEIEKRQNARFAKLEDKDIQPSSLPSPLFIDSVYLGTLGEKIREGVVYIPISHAGYHPTTIIYIARSDEIKYSLFFPSLSSRVQIEKGELAPDDVQW
ncbi:MAG: prepilin-type N-terminal cleavage/methylation domain-containing protein [Bdellovibrionales bacterium]|nr:prepilin-type N-terminal cleavage/methylation domain-containing protein [Bdellovibrionales bacterium]